jgi:hypothetical protein
MTVTDEMVELACNTYDTYNSSHNQILLRGVATAHGMKAALEAALSTIKPMTSRDIDSMMQRGCIDDTVDLVEAVEYWHGIRE